MIRTFLVAALVAVLLVACGGGETVVQQVSWAKVVGCDAVEVHDSGYVVYVTVRRDCEPARPLQVTLGTRVPFPTGTFAIQAQDFDVPQAIEVEPGVLREVSVHRRGTWRSYDHSHAWDWRDGAGLLVKDGGLYLLGGWNSVTVTKNDVWFTRNLRGWSELTHEAPWAPRHGAAWLVHQERLWVIGGDLIDDAWSSADGVTWRREVADAPFGKRYTPNAISDGTRMFLFAGQYWAPYDWCAFQPECQAIGLNDVWSSTDGVQWTPLGTAPWAGRGLIHGGAYFRGRIYVIGGGLKLGLPGAARTETVQEFSDIWSSADGVVWRLEATSLGFPPRTHFAILATETGCWLANGSVGIQLNTSSEVFHARDCVHFAPVVAESSMGHRHASSLAEWNGSIVVLGGHIVTAGTLVWQYFPPAESDG